MLTFTRWRSLLNQHWGKKLISPVDSEYEFKLFVTSNKPWVVYSQLHRSRCVSVIRRTIHKASDLSLVNIPAKIILYISCSYKVQESSKQRHIEFITYFHYRNISKLWKQSRILWVVQIWQTITLLKMVHRDLICSAHPQVLTRI